MSTLARLLDAVRDNAAPSADFSAADEPLSPAQAHDLADALSVNTALTALDLSHMDLAVEGVAALAMALQFHGALRSLTLRDTNMTDQCALPWAAMLRGTETLTHFDCSGNPLNDAGVEAIASALDINMTLTSLRLADTRPGPDGLAALCRVLRTNSGLTALDLSDCGLEPSGLRTLCAALPDAAALRDLALRGRDLPAEDLQEVARALPGSLTALDLSDTLLSDDALTAFAAALAPDPGLAQLRLGHNGLTACGPVAAVLGACGALTALDLAGNGLADAGVAGLADALAAHARLTELSLADNGLTDAALRSLGAALRRGAALQSLDVARNQIAGPGLRGLAAALQHQPPLALLNLAHNPVGDTGFGFLAAALHSNTALQTLVAHHCRMGDAGAGYMGQALRHNAALRVLDVSANALSDRARDSLAAGLAHNRGLVVLCLSGGARLGPDAARRFALAAERHASLVRLVLPPGLPEEAAARLKAALRRNVQRLAGFVPAGDTDMAAVLQDEPLVADPGPHPVTLKKRRTVGV